MRARHVWTLAALLSLSACYSDMQYGMEEPSEDEANAEWFCNYYNSCEKSGGNIWGASSSNGRGAVSIWGGGAGGPDNTPASSSSSDSSGN